MTAPDVAEAARATLSRQHYRCLTCDRPFQQFLGVNLPVDLVVKQMRRVRCPYCGGKKIGMGEGRTLAEDRSMRTQIDGPPELRAGLWLAEGEVGTSSKTITWFMLGQIERYPDVAAPSDLDDVRRCLILLDRVPEWAERMPEMVSLPQWERLASAWATIADAYLAECPNLDRLAPRAQELLNATRPKS